MRGKKISRGRMRYTKNRSPLTPIVLAILAAALVALAGAALWQKAEKGKNPSPSSEESSVISIVSSMPEPSSEEEPSSISEAESSRNEDAVSTADPFFDGAVFIGDSITDGIKSYGLMKNATVISNTGLNPETILTGKKIKTSSGYVTALEALARTNPKKVYILLGANGIAWFSEDYFVKEYGLFVDAVKEQHPESTVYIQSILPVTKAYSNANNGVTNAKIDQYNARLKQLAQEKGVQYVNVAEALKDSYGALPAEASPTDGMHFGPTYYKKWFAYLKTHTA